MYGVVLWSDPAVSTAVIWCEDHGDLAFYKSPEVQHIKPAFFLDAGDYVEFEVEVEDDMRKAVNARTIDAGYCPSIAETLQSTQPANGPSGHQVLCHPDMSKVIQMPQARAKSVRA